MALARIRLSLKNNRTAQPTQHDGGAISAAYSQIQQTDQPKVLYEENTLPTEQGIQSAGLIDKTQRYDFPNPMPDATVIHTELGTDVNQNIGELILQIPTYRGTGQMLMRRNVVSPSMLHFLSHNAQGDTFLHKRTTLFQTRTVFITVPDDTPEIPVVGDAGAGNGIYEFDYAKGELIYSNFTGINFAQIKPYGITSHENYLVVFNRTTVYWSNPINYKDFSPAVGAGGSAKIAEARGAIITVIPYYNGLMVYCAENIVSMTFSGDTSNPWIFREVPNSAGLYISNSIYHTVPLACVNEQQQVQFAMLNTGLHAVTENGIKPLPETIFDLVGRNYIDYKEKGKSEITPEVAGELDFPVTALQDMFSFGSLLFMILGSTGTQRKYNRMVVYNTETRAFGTIRGNWRSVHPQTNNSNITGENIDAVQGKPRAIPNSYVLVEWEGDTVCRGYVMTTQTKANQRPNDLVNDSELAEAEVLVGPISISQERMTAVYSVKFGPNDTNGTPTSERVRVFAFDTTTQTGDTPVEFIYNEVDNRYYGYIEGPLVRLLLVGRNFHLSVIEIEAEEGGIY